MSPVPIILAALASSNRSVGGGFSAANNNTCHAARIEWDSVTFLFNYTA